MNTDIFGRKDEEGCIRVEKFIFSTQGWYYEFALRGIKSEFDVILKNMGQICINEEDNILSPQKEMTLQENDCRDVHVSPDIGSDTITKVYLPTHFLFYFIIFYM